MKKFWLKLLGRTNPARPKYRVTLTSWGPKPMRVGTFETDDPDQLVAQHVFKTGEMAHAKVERVK